MFGVGARLVAGRSIVRAFVRLGGPEPRVSEAGIGQTLSFSRCSQCIFDAQGNPTVSEWASLLRFHLIVDEQSLSRWMRLAPIHAPARGVILRSFASLRTSGAQRGFVAVGLCSHECPGGAAVRAIVLVNREQPEWR